MYKITELYKELKTKKTFLKKLKACKRVLANLLKIHFIGNKRCKA